MPLKEHGIRVKERTQAIKHTWDGYKACCRPECLTRDMTKTKTMGLAFITA